LEVLLSVESDCLGLDLSLLDINFVSGQDDGDVLADTDQVTYAMVSTLLAPMELCIDSRCQLGTFL
jgi:hypothetical protein